MDKCVTLLPGNSFMLIFLSIVIDKLIIKGELINNQKGRLDNAKMRDLSEETN